METYIQLKRRHEKEGNELPMFFAFSNQQLERAMAKIGLTIEADDLKKIYSLGGGGFCLRQDIKEIHSCFTRQDAELEAAFKADVTGAGFCYQAFDFELSNHEYCVTGSVEDALDSLGLTLDDVRESEAMRTGLNMSIREQRRQHA